MKEWSDHKYLHEKFQLLSSSPSTLLWNRVTVLLPVDAIGACHTWGRELRKSTYHVLVQQGSQTLITQIPIPPMPKVKQVLSSCVKALIRLYLRWSLRLRQKNKHPIGTHVGLNYQTFLWMKYFAHLSLDQNSQASFLQLPYVQEIISQLWNIVYLNNMIDSIQQQLHTSFSHHIHLSVVTQFYRMSKIFIEFIEHSRSPHMWLEHPESRNHAFSLLALYNST